MSLLFLPSPLRAYALSCCHVIGQLDFGIRTGVPDKVYIFRLLLLTVPLARTYATHDQ